MNVRFRFVVLSLAVLTLGACASMDERTTTAPQSRAGYVQDGQYVATVEYIAKRRGVEVVWVNPPKRRVGNED